MKKRVLALISVLAMSINMVLPVSAAENTESNMVYHINPVYQDVVTEEDLKDCPIESGIAAYARADYTSDVQEVAALIRETMVERGSSEEIPLTIYYKQKGAMNSSFLRKWIDLAVEETGNPKEGDYLRWHYAGAKASYERTGIENNIYEYKVDIVITYYTTAEQEAELDAAIADLLEQLGITDEMQDLEKVRRIYDYMCENIEYDYEHLYEEYDLMYTAYAAMINKRSVCQGYANLLYRLLHEVGVNSRIISGVTGTGAHSWNIIKLGDKYYLADATWDATWAQAGYEYQYYLKGSDNFEDHINDPRYTTEEFVAEYPVSASDYDPNQVPEEVPDDDSTEIPEETPEDILPGVWKRNNTGWWYEFSDGSYPKAEWMEIDGVRYYFNPSGYCLQNAWLAYDGGWYYLSASGAVTTGWFKLKGVWYYGDDEGCLYETEWLNDLYYFHDGGAMATGWVLIDGDYYYFAGSGAKVTSSWVGKYYLKSTGVMAVSEWVDNGKSYVNAAGAYVTGWLKLDGSWYYLGTNGVKQTGWIISGNVWYYLKSDGTMASNEWIEGYYLSSSGAWIPGYKN